MAYEKQTWATGDVITAEKLNHIEDGIGGILFIVHKDGNNVLDKTWQEIYDAMQNGQIVILAVNEEDYVYSTLIDEVSAYRDQDEFIVRANVAYTTDSPNGYPSNGMS